MRLPLILAAAAFVPMIFEARLSARHTRALLAAGAVEPPGDVIALMQFAYPACFVVMIVAAWVGGAQPDRTFAAGAMIFAAAKTLKYWAVATLGPRWTFRVLVPPGSTRVSAGPYRFMRHPNYVAITGELAGMALMAHAPIAGVVMLTTFGLLIVARIRVEERALGLGRRA